MEAVQGLSRWAIECALRADGQFGGLVAGGHALAAGRPGWQLFGLPEVQ
jgi:hypothetical protein